MLKLEDVIGDQIEAKGHALAKAVVENVLTCFQSRDPRISLEPVVQQLTMETREAARGITELFEHEPEDVLGSHFCL
jgi:hypothetical protein